MTTTTKRQRHSNIMASAKFADHQQAALDLLQQLTADIERLQEAHDFLTNTDEE